MFILPKYMSRCLNVSPSVYSCKHKKSLMKKHESELEFSNRKGKSVSVSVLNITKVIHIITISRIFGLTLLCLKSPTLVNGILYLVATTIALFCFGCFNYAGLITCLLQWGGSCSRCYCCHSCYFAVSR